MASDWNRSDELQKAFKGAERKTAIYEWMRQRSTTVRQNVSAFDVLRHFNIALKFGGDGHEEQFSCPFHGKDTKPSARVYPDGPRSSSHVWCYTCQKRWDVFGLWRNFMGHEEGIRFGQIVFELERAFGILPPEGPELLEEVKDRGPSEAEKLAAQLFEVCENRLREAKPKYESPDKFAQAGQLLDKWRYRFENRSIPIEEVTDLLRTFIDRIGERIRA